MPDEPQTLDDLLGSEREFAEAVRGLRLRPPRMTAEQVWFGAGFEAGHRRVVAWRVVAIAAVMLGGASLLRQGIGGPGANRVPASQQEARAPATSDPVPSLSVAKARMDVTLPDQSASIVNPVGAPYLVLRNAVVKDGWNALPLKESGGLKGFVPKDWPPEQEGMQSDAL